MPTQSTQQLAYDLAQLIAAHPNTLELIHSGIEEVVSYGLDENLAYYDMLNTSQSKFITNTDMSEIRQNLNMTTLNDLGMRSNNYFNDLNVYWGYHDMWDHNSLPTICYIDENTTPDMTRGYKIDNNGSISEVTVTEEEFDKTPEKPILVVNFREVQYNQYPDFKLGQRSKDGAYWPDNSSS